MQNVLRRIAATLVILCPVVVFSIPESAIQASSIKSSQTEQVKNIFLIYSYFCRAPEENIKMYFNPNSTAKSKFKLKLFNLKYLNATTTF
jgi:hypothetical protein